MAIVSLVLEKPLGAQAEGTVLQVDEEVAQALITSGVCREATEEDLVGGDDAEEGDEVTEEEDNPAVVEDQVARVQRHVEETITKAAEKVAEKVAALNVKRPGVKPRAGAGVHVAGSDELRTGGFKNVGECAQMWMRKKKGDYDAIKRFSRYENLLRTKTPTEMSISGSHVGSDLVPQEWASQLWKLAFDSVPDLLGMMTKYEMRNQVENIPAWVQASATSAITAAVTAEGAAITATAGATQTVQLSLNKGAVLVNVTDELLRFNSYNLTTVLQQVVPQRIRFLVNDSVVNGTSSGINLKGNSVAITVTREANNHISYNDVLTMYAALFDDFVDGACWLINQSTAPELYGLGFPSRAADTQFPVFTPGGGFGDSLKYKPVGNLLGLPVYRVENCPSLGAKGDIILFNPKSCAAAYSEVFADSTPYLYFDLATDSFRFLFYFDSVNPMTSVYTRQDGSTAANIVVLSASSSA